MSKGNSGLFSGTLGSPQLTFGGEIQWANGDYGISSRALYIVKIKNGYLHGPIQVYDSNGTETNTLPVIFFDGILNNLNDQVCKIYSSYFELNSHGQPCGFDYEKEKADKDRMLSLIKAILNRLDEINDGTFKVVDCESERLNSL